MPVAINDLMAKAKSLSTSECEVDLRLAIRCAYYFSYHYLLDPLCLMYSLEEPPAHKLVAGYLKDVSKNKTHRKAAMDCGAAAELAAKKYSAMKYERVIADYNLKAEVSSELVALQLERMAEINKISVQLRSALKIQL